MRNEALNTVSAPRHFVIGDIHGHYRALQSLLDTLQPQTEDRFTFLGDYVDRGPNSKDVLDAIMSLPCSVDALMGNHEAMLLASLTDTEAERHWLHYGGSSTLDSFGVSKVQNIPKEYLSWMAELPYSLETDAAIFVHASVDPTLPLPLQTPEQLMWRHNKEPIHHYSGKRIYCGHTPHDYPAITPYWICLDTGIGSGGLLSCLEIQSCTLAQADRLGQVTQAASPAVFNASRLDFVGSYQSNSTFRHPNQPETGNSHHT